MSTQWMRASSRWVINKSRLSRSIVRLFFSGKRISSQEDLGDRGPTETKVLIRSYNGWLVYFLKDEKDKIQFFLSGLTTFYKYYIRFNTPSTFKEDIKKGKMMYQKNKGRVDLQKTQKRRVHDNKYQRRKDYRPNIVPNITNNMPRNVIRFEGSKVSQSIDQNSKFTLQCWNYGGEHFG